METSSAETGSSQTTTSGLQNQRAGDADSLRLAAGKFVRVAIDLLRQQAHVAHHFDDFRLPLLRASSAERRSAAARR